VRPEVARSDKLRWYGLERARLKKPRQLIERSLEIFRQLLEAQEERIRSRLRVPSQEMVAPGTEIPTGNDGVEIDIAALSPQEFPQAATAIAAVAYDIDRFSVIDRPFMGFDEWKLEEIGREFPVDGTLKMAGLLRHRQVATQSFR
jgi:hypothetical protein